MESTTEEVEKGVINMCKYCEGESELITNLNKDVFDIQVLDGFLYTWCSCGRHQVTEISYCPMCGKRLGDE